MKIICSLIFVMNIIIYIPAEAQKFWLTTNEFWGGPKTGIALVDDSLFFVSTTNSVLRSSNGFNQLELLFSASEIHTLFASASGRLYAGGSAKIFYSYDRGMSWDSAEVNTSYSFKQIIENREGDLFAVTGIYDQGDGVFFSSNGGSSWEKRNTGLGLNPGCDEIAVDQNGRLYLTTSDEAATGLGGLYISDNNGLQWYKISIGIDSINTSVRIGSTTNLSILPNDSIYLSFTGSAANFGVELNIFKSIHDISNDSLWKILDVKHYTITGMDDALNNIYIAKNGDWYSSITESVSTGGTCYSKDGKNWEVLDYGLGVDINYRRNEQYFAENKSGRIFMIQYMDERIYQTDTSIVTGITKQEKVNPRVNIYPNPIRKGENFTLHIDKVDDSAEIFIYDLNGKSMYYTRAYNSQANIPAPDKEGIYIVSFKNACLEKALKIVVN